MPNCYTAGVQDGSVTSLREYLQLVGRSMSMAIMQRDEALDAPVRLRRHSTYSLDRLDEAIKERQRVAELSDREVSEECAREFGEARKRALERRAENEQQKKRYDDMIAKVQAWQPDPLIASTKEYALKYLVESKQFDCWSEKELDRFAPLPEEPASVDEWRREKIEQAEHDIEYHSKQWEEECERVDDFNKHILAFHRSLPNE